jgi:hypothetical protein
MNTRPIIVLTLAALSLTLGGCAWWEDMTEQPHAAAAPQQGAANFNNMMSAIGNEPEEGQRLSELSNVSSRNVIIANVDMIARGGSGRQLDQAMHDNARSIENLRGQIAHSPALKQVLDEHNIPVNNVVALDVTSGGGIVIYALPAVQAGAGPSAQQANPDAKDR